MKRVARPITAKYLQNAAAFYLERYPSTAEGLRRVLNRRVAKAMEGLDLELDTNPTEREWKAAVALARRRRLGPFRHKDRKEHRTKDLAAMARGGFDYQLARKVIDAVDPDSLDGA